MLMLLLTLQCSYLSHVVGKEEVVSKEHDRCKELTEACLVLVGCQQLLQPNLLEMIMMVDIF